MNAAVTGRGDLTVTTAIERPVSIEACDATSVRMLYYAVSNSWIPSDFEDYCHGE
jgi:hypothetical protein